MDKNQKGFANIITIGLIGLLIAGAFIIGTLWTKVKVLEQEKEVVAGGQVKDVEENKNKEAAGNEPEVSLEKVPDITEKDHVRGESDAPIALIEYSDFECPFCKDFHETVTKIVSEYKGQVKWVFRHYPLPFHANAQKFAEASECAAELGGNDAFWKYADRIYEEGAGIKSTSLQENLISWASEDGLDKSKFKECLESGKYEGKTKEQMNSGSAAGVQGTPGSFILNVKTGKAEIVSGALPFDQIKQMIDQALK